MNVLVIMAAGLGALGVGSRVYGRRVARRLGVEPDRPTPAQVINDGRDYVPTRLPVLFAHHFATIAGAGPIVGPTMAVIYGFVPAVLWVVLGGIFLGAVHDFSVLFASLREGGHSMAEIAHKCMGRVGFVLFISFTIVMLVLVTAVFLKLTATALTSLWPLAKLGLEAGTGLLKTEIRDGVPMGRIGGIASTSVIVITCFAPVLGYLIYRRGIAIRWAYALGVLLCAVSIMTGLAHPVAVSPTTWSLILSVYVFFAAGAPVWIILQPRDFVNSMVLYAGMAVLGVSLLLGGAGGLSVQFPAFNLSEGMARLGLVWPMMFVTIACGAISGFHSLVSSGTSAKQCAAERDAKRIGYDGMILECVLALFVLLAIGSSLAVPDYRTVVWQDKNAVLGFSLAAGHLVHRGLPFIPMALGTVFGILMLEGFLVTTLDSAVRLNRYLFEELWSLALRRPPALMRKYWFNAGLAVLLMWVMAQSGAADAIWPVFGSSNQLLAALALLVVSTWLLNRQGVVPWFTLVPAIFMMATTLVSLVLLFRKYLASGSWLLLGADVVLLLLAAGVIAIAARTYLRRGCPAAATAAS